MLTDQNAVSFSCLYLRCVLERTTLSADKYLRSERAQDEQSILKRKCQWRFLPFDIFWSFRLQQSFSALLFPSLYVCCYRDDSSACVFVCVHCGLSVQLSASLEPPHPGAGCCDSQHIDIFCGVRSLSVWGPPLKAKAVLSICVCVCVVQVSLVFSSSECVWVGDMLWQQPVSCLFCSSF